MSIKPKKLKFLAIFSSVLIVGSILHVLFIFTNDILKNADNFAYLQMSYYFENFSVKGFGTGWFGFVYSLFIAIFDKIIFFINEYYSALILNILLFAVGGIILYNISRLYLNKYYSLLVLFLYYLSPILLSFNISILSENIYIPLFLFLVYYLLKLDKLDKLKKISLKDIFTISLTLSLLYFTRSEAFIYIGSVILIFVFTSSKNIFSKKWFKRVFKKCFFLIAFFLLLISPYIVYLHTITGEWGLTNKGSSNLRQAELRGTSKMDDDGFEQAVAELTDDNHHLKAGFAGGLDYYPSEETGGIVKYFLDNPQKVISRFFTNQKKLYLENLPEMISGNTISLFGSKDSIFYRNYIFFTLVIFPIFFVLFGISRLFRKKEYNLLLILGSFYLVASVFFTIFFVLNRYFVIFLPFFIFFIVYGISNLKLKSMNNLFKLGFIGLVLCVNLLGNFVYYNSVKAEDDKYEVKKGAGENLNTYILKSTSKDIEKVKIMERFPIVTYYAGVRNRFITPYTDNLKDLLEYAKYNKIDYFIVDSLDFATYRSNLKYILNDDFFDYNMKEIFEFEQNGQKVKIFEFNF